MPQDLKEEKTVEYEWQTYWSYVKPDKCPAHQENDMKMSFFAGAYSLIRIMMSLSDEDVSIEGGAHIFEGLKQEVETFHVNQIARIRKGK